MKYLILILTVTLLLCSCVSSNKTNSGLLKTPTTLVEQVEDAKTPATLDENINSTEFQYQVGDIIEIKEDGIVIKPNSTGVFQTKNSIIQASTGSSYKNNAKEISATLSGFKPVTYVALALIVSAPISFLLVRSLQASFLLGGTGVTLLLLASVLPAVYSNFVWLVLISLIGLPIMVYFAFKRKERLYSASQKAFEHLKIAHPEIAKESKSVFKQNIDVDDQKNIKNN